VATAFQSGHAIAGEVTAMSTADINVLFINLCTNPYGQALHRLAVSPIIDIRVDVVRRRDGEGFSGPHDRKDALFSAAKTHKH
jgi:hypothetical protein